jgi:hypothetical protein
MAGQRVVVPCALISPRPEMCEQSEQSELSLLLFPGRAPRWEVVETIFCRRLQESASASVPTNSCCGFPNFQKEVREKRDKRDKSSYVPACQFFADRGRSASVSLGMGRLRPVAGDVVSCKFSKLLNQEDALGAPCFTALSQNESAASRGRVL